MFSPSFSIGNSSQKEVNEFFLLIQKIGKPKSIKKGTKLIRSGSHASFFFYIINGVFRSTTTVKNREYIIGFTFTDDVDCCPVSLLNGTQNNFNIEAVVDSEVLVCELKDFQNATSQKKYLGIINTVLVNYLSVVESRIMEAISLTAEERYRNLLEQQPNQVKQIPLTYIAGYLGITLERLSRIRKRLAI